MEIYTPKQSKRRQTKLEDKRIANVYPHSLQFYQLPPFDNITLHEFEQFAVDRLKVLKTIETVGIKHIRGAESYKTAVIEDLKKQGLHKFIPKPGNVQVSETEFDDRRKDHISHFILRLAYCRSEDLRRWFMQQELDLFRFKFVQETKGSIQEFLELNRLNYVPIPTEEKNSIMKELVECSREKSLKIDNEDYYKVPFTEVLDLVRTRKVFIRDGMAFVPQSELVVIVIHHYRKQLSHALALTCRALPHLEEDGRLLPMLSGLSKRYLGDDYTNKKPVAGEVKAEMIDGLAKKNFPLCMLSLHQGLRQTHHLKHWGRLQYGLFLKAIGLSLEEAMKFWRTEFLKTMDSDKFDKQYSYGVRYNYGKEGKRTDYTPYSCIKIITSNAPGAGDFHGCPFKHSDVDMLRQKLQGLVGSKSAMDSILSYVKGGHYQLACGEYFKFHHGERDSFSPNHPNQYFDETMKSPDQDQNSAQRIPGGVIKVKASQGQSQPSSTPEMEFENNEPFSAEALDDMFKNIDADSS